MQKPYDIQLELYSSVRKQTGIVYYRGDENAYPLTLRLYHHGNAYPVPDGTQAYVSFRRPDRVVDKSPATVMDAEQGVLQYDIVGSELSVLGEVVADVELTGPDGQRLTWPPFSFRVAGPVDDAGAQPPQAYTNWTRDINARVQSLEQSGTAAKDLDGGSPADVFLPDQYIDGGWPDTVYADDQTIDGGVIT